MTTHPENTTTFARLGRFALPSLFLPLLGMAASDATLPPPPESAIPAQGAATNPALPTVFVVGDSTAANGSPGAIGWGRSFPTFFDLTKVNVVNRARGGRSSRTFLTEGLWDEVLAELKAGDVVLIQFGHNDGGLINDEHRARGSLPGLGDEIRQIDNLQTRQPETVRTFGAYLRTYLADVKAKGATPILLSLTVRNRWQNAQVERGSGRYGAWASELARAERIEFLDLTTLIADEYERLGEAAVQTFFPKDHTHTSEAGAELNARLVVAGLKALGRHPLAGVFSAKGAAVPAASSAAMSATWLGLPRPADPSLPNLVLIGDSTVRNGRGDGEGGQWGWGDALSDHFDPARLNVVNRAVGGLSSRTYLTSGHWERALALLKPGDAVIMQFGHNDSAPLNDTSRARGTIRGVGDESEAIDNLLTGQPEVVRSYGWYLRKYIADTRARGAVPIVASLVPRKRWTDGRINRDRESYAGWAEQVARAEGVPFLDLNERIARRYEELGPDQVEPLFADEHTHTSRTGAELNAACVVEALRALAINPLAPYLATKGGGLPYSNTRSLRCTTSRRLRPG